MLDMWPHLFLLYFLFPVIDTIFLVMALGADLVLPPPTAFSSFR